MSSLQSPKPGHSYLSSHNTVIRVVNITCHPSLSNPTQDAALREKFCLRCCNIGDSFQSAHHHLLTPSSLKQSQMPSDFPRGLPFSIRVTVVLNVYCNSSCPLQTASILHCVSGLGERGKISGNRLAKPQRAHSSWKVSLRNCSFLYRCVSSP